MTAAAPPGSGSRGPQGRSFPTDCPIPARPLENHFRRHPAPPTVFVRAPAKSCSNALLAFERFRYFRRGARIFSLQAILRPRAGGTWSNNLCCLTKFLLQQSRAGRTIPTCGNCAQAARAALTPGRRAQRASYWPSGKEICYEKPNLRVPSGTRTAEKNLLNAENKKSPQKGSKKITATISRYRATEANRPEPEAVAEAAAEPAAESSDTDSSTASS